MNKSEDLIRTTSKLYETRDAARAILGDRFKQKMDEHGKAITDVMKARGIDAVQAATLLCNVAGEGMPQVLILAAMVELVEPSTL